ncbi:MAG: UvrD-helicase domain-containing protein [Candidatus Yanofskybacteria bacterium]|nr:UvrD-helicase domain-containing protein [Candidatus Yanofskybacteria bacterium]
MENIENSKIFADLNDKQIEAVRAIEGPVLILAGAGSGKCVSGDTLIFTGAGIIPIEEIPLHFGVSSQNDCSAPILSHHLNGSFSIKNTSHWFRFPKTKVIKISTKSGYQITGTYEHPLLVLNREGELEFKKLRDLKNGEVVAISKNNNIWGNYNLHPEIAYLMGLLVGDGYLGFKSGIGFAQVSENLIKAFKNILKKFFQIQVAKIKSRERYPAGNKRRSTTHYVYNMALKRELEGLGLKMVGSHHKSIPQSVLTAPKDSAKAFLQGLFDTDGSVSGATVELTTASETLAKQVHVCLLNFGIRASLRPKFVKSYRNNTYWRIAIMGTSLRTFAAEVGFRYQDHKIEKLQAIANKVSNSNVEVIPFQNLNIKHFKDRYLLGTEIYDGKYYYIFPETHNKIYIRDYLRRRRNPSPWQLERILKTAGNGARDPRVEYMFNLTRNFFFDPVVEVAREKEKIIVYDFTVPKNHTFVGNGFINHNTRALTHRIAYMIANNIPPQNILAVTFTNKAAGEIKERVVKLLSETQPKTYDLKPITSPSPWLGTFHSICLRILRHDIKTLPPYTENFVVYDEDDQLGLIKNVMRELELDIKKFNPKNVLGRISALKSELIGYEEFTEKAREYFEKIVAPVYTGYQITLQQNNALDFDDLIMLCVRLFQKHPEILEKYQNLFRYILIDEYQDTNHSQYVWVNLLAQKHRNLFVIGDDYQSIYSFRLANIRNILDFEKDYPEAKIILLEQNYRSTGNILAAANNIIIKNKNQKHKKLWTENSAGDEIILKEAANERREGDYVIETVRNNLKQGRGLQDFTILYRTHAQSRAIEEAMIKHGLPYRILGGVKFYQRREIKDILAYLRLAVNPNDLISWSRIYNVPGRGIGQTTWQKIKEARKLNIAETIKNITLESSIGQKQTIALKLLAKFIEELSQKSAELSPSQLIKYILQKTNYELYINDKTTDGEERWENVKEILTATRKYDSETAPNGLQKFLEEVALIQETDKIDKSGGAINLMTIHSAKGLEFPIVFIIGMEDGIFPHSRALFEPAELEEERRLCYVGITRAKEQLHLTYCRERMFYGSTQLNPPSRFLFEIPEHLLNYSPLSQNKYTEDWDDKIEYY